MPFGRRSYKRRSAPNKVSIPYYSRAYASRTRPSGYPKRRRYIGSRKVAVRMTGSRYRATMQSRYTKGRLRSAAAFLQYPDLAAARLRAAMKLSPCVELWIKSLINPFDGPLNACNPYTPPVYSERLRVWVRFNHTPSTYKSTSVPDTPVPLLLFAGPGSDSPFCMHPLAGAYNTGTSFSAMTLTNHTNNSPLNNADFQAQNSFAIVSMGMRARYVGTADAMNGYIGIFEDPNHDNLAKTGAYSEDHVHGDNAYKIVPVSTDWITILWSGPRTNLQRAIGFSAANDHGAQSEYFWANTYRFDGSGVPQIKFMSGPQVLQAKWRTATQSVLTQRQTRASRRPACTWTSLPTTTPTSSSKHSSTSKSPAAKLVDQSTRNKNTAKHQTRKQRSNSPLAVQALAAQHKNSAGTHKGLNSDFD